MRTITQISTVSDGEAVFLYALCSDGTLWHWSFKVKSWVEIAGIPAAASTSVPAK